jgi:phage baseplate assembly protein W
MAAPKPFIGKGWTFPIAPAGPMPPVTASVPNPSNPIPWVQDEDKIRQSMWIILSTAPGERPMQPDFGCGIQNRLFANLDEASVGQLLNDVTTALAQWEPRIDVVAADAAPQPDQPNVLLISIDYQVRATNSRFNLVYPLYVS